MKTRRIHTRHRTRNYRPFAVLLLLAGTVFLLAQCMNSASTAAGKKDFAAYAGADKCMSCHKETYDAHIRSAHFLTGQPATEQFLKGSFSEGSNKYVYNPELFVKMDKKDSGYYQTVFFRGEQKLAMRYEIVIGSGVMGQSFLTRRKDKYYQMPVTYYTAADQWSNSPGFPEKKVGIDKLITSRCLECHLTYAEGMGGTPEEPQTFNPDRMVFGVSCEKCHGPAAAHVSYHTANPKDTTARHIVNPASLSRTRQLDICALCHAGNINKSKPSFTFTAGEDLKDYFDIHSLDQAKVDNGAVDVHGNQLGLLMASACFKKSVSLTCNSCHNSHANERGQTAVFSQRCISCHATAAASFQTPAHKAVKGIERNCIDCHMPSQASRAIAVHVEGEEAARASYLRTHLISIYPNETTNYINQQAK